LFFNNAIVIHELSYRLIVIPAKAGIHWYIPFHHGSSIKPPVQALEGDDEDDGTSIHESLYYENPSRFIAMKVTFDTYLNQYTW